MARKYKTITIPKEYYKYGEWRGEGLEPSVPPFNTPPGYNIPVGDKSYTHRYYNVYYPTTPCKNIVLNARRSVHAPYVCPQCIQGSDVSAALRNNGERSAFVRRFASLKYNSSKVDYRSETFSVSTLKQPNDSNGHSYCHRFVCGYVRHSN